MPLRPRTHADDRGLDQSPDLRPPQGRFGKMFPSLRSADFNGAVKGRYGLKRLVERLAGEAFLGDDVTATVEEVLAALDKQENQGQLVQMQPRAQQVLNDLKRLQRFGLGQRVGAEAVLKALAQEMVNADLKEGLIPAGYTYLGQFISHDLTFDPVSSLQRDSDPASLVDFRTPRFDLDSVYGRGPTDDPYLYRKDGIRMRLGRQLTDGEKPIGYDVPRPEKPDPRTRGDNDCDHAMIGDPRNDENVIIAQLHALFLRFHNRMADKLKEDNGGVEPTFADVQRAVRWHYQWLVLYDFLPRIIDPSIYNEILPNVHGGVAEYVPPPLEPQQNVCEAPPSLRFYKPIGGWYPLYLDREPYMPVEFSAAAYRFGHSMVRDNYRLNNNESRGIGGPFGILGNDPATDLRGFRRFSRQWAIDWGFFFEGLGIPPDQVQRASQIDTSLAKALKTLPFPFAAAVPNLAERNLVRGLRLGLPSGQSMARAFGEEPLSDEKLTVEVIVQGAKRNVPITEISDAFRGNAPLWFYILAEAQNRMAEVEKSLAEAAEAHKELDRAHVTLTEAAEKVQNELGEAAPKGWENVVQVAETGVGASFEAEWKPLVEAAERKNKLAEAQKLMAEAAGAKKKVAEAQEKLAKAAEVHGLTDQQRTGLERAHWHLFEIQNQLAGLQENVAAAIQLRNLEAEGRNQHLKGKVAEAQNKRDAANIALAKTQFQLAKAQNELTAEQKKGLEKAQNKLETAKIDLARAQSELLEEQNGLAKEHDTLLEPQKEFLADATKELVKAQRGVTAAKLPLAKFGTLGPVGSRIVMETFVGLMWADEYSFLQQEPNWKPFVLAERNHFGMAEFINFAQGPAKQADKAAGVADSAATLSIRR